MTTRYFYTGTASRNVCVKMQCQINSMYMRTSFGNTKQLGTCFIYILLTDIVNEKCQVMATSTSKISASMAGRKNSKTVRSGWPTNEHEHRQMTPCCSCAPRVIYIGMERQRRSDTGANYRCPYHPHSPGATECHHRVLDRLVRGKMEIMGTVYCVKPHTRGATRQMI